MTTTQDMLDRFRTQRPVVRLAIIAVGALCLYTFLDEYPWALARHWSQQADHMQEVMREGAAHEEPLPSKVRDAIAVYGQLDIPGSEAEGANALSLAVNEAARKNKVLTYTFQTRSGGKLPKSASAALGLSGRIERLVGEVNFTATPQDTFGFMQSLEASAAVDAIGSVRMDWDPKLKRVVVRLMAESWVTGSSKGSS